MKLLKIAALAGALALGAMASTATYAANIVETAASAGSFKTLIAAAKAAGLADALATTPNITVFAPTDEAFAALPPGTVETLLKPENKDKLVAILTLHVLPRELKSTHLLSHKFKVKTLNLHKRLTIDASGRGVAVSASNTAHVETADIKADNGVIHVIDAVLLP